MFVVTTQTVGFLPGLCQHQVLYYRRTIRQVFMAIYQTMQRYEWRLEYTHVAHTQRERERQRDRETESERARARERQRARERDRERETESESEGWEAGRQADRKGVRHRQTQTDR